MSYTFCAKQRWIKQHNLPGDPKRKASGISLEFDRLRILFVPVLRRVGMHNASLGGGVNL